MTTRRAPALAASWRRKSICGAAIAPSRYIEPVAS
jgi:hypothetical protein